MFLFWEDKTLSFFPFYFFFFSFFLAELPLTLLFKQMVRQTLFLFFLNPIGFISVQTLYLLMISTPSQGLA